jgi:hypothetical protein
MIMKSLFLEGLDTLYTMIVVSFKIFYMLGVPMLIGVAISMVANPTMQLIFGVVVAIIFLLFFPLVMSIPPDREDF